MQDYTSEELYKMTDLIENSSLSMPRSLYGNSTTQTTYKSRDEELRDRQMLYDDAFARGLVDILVSRSLGAEYDNLPPYKIVLDDDIKLPSKIIEEINREFIKIRNMTAKIIKPICKDGEFLGDGYLKREIKEGEGITNMIYDYTTKPQFITPIKSSKSGSVVLYEVAIETKQKNTTSRVFIHPNKVGHLNSSYNGTMTIQSENFMQLENMNVWNEEETFFEDFIYGGCIEGAIEYYKKYKWAIEALFNARVSSSIIHRFITHNLSYLSIEEREELQKAFNRQLKKASEKIKSKSNTLDPTATIFNMYVPTIGDGTGGVDIHTESIDFNLSIDDALLHIKNFIGALGFPLALTVYGDNVRGGAEPDGQDNNSLQLNSHAERIRDSVIEFLKDTIQVHIKYKYNNKITIKRDYIKIEFLSVANQAKAIQEHNRLQAIDNNTQVAGLIAQWKELNLKDTPSVRKYMFSMLKDILNPNLDEAVIKELLDIFFTKEKEE